jgi:Esterase/lipase
VRYRLAPEHNLYAGREDFLAALNWVAEHGSSIGIDSTRLAIGGDSAGGNISAAVAQENMRRGGPALKMQVLVYPATLLLGEFPSKSENAHGYLLTSDFIDSLEPLIVQGADLTDPWLSPGCADRLQGLPPALVITAGSIRSAMTDWLTTIDFVPQVLRSRACIIPASFTASSISIP